MINDFLFEIGCEELPSGSVLPLAEELHNLVAKALEKTGLSYREIQHFATPRRIALIIHDLVDTEPAQQIIKRGPSVHLAFDAKGEPTPALLGFARSCGIDYKILKTQKTDKGDFLCYETEIAGKRTIERMPELLEKAIASLTTFQPMRWGEGDFQFARPVHWILMLYGEEVVPAVLFGLASDRLSYGHRFHHKEALTIQNANDYVTALEKAFVVVEFAKRKKMISDKVKQLAVPLSAEAIIPDSLLDEVCSIVEWPEALLVHFNEAFLTVPEEALIAAMQVHQKCFALKSNKGSLLPYFITISNILSQNTSQVIAGNAKVMQARLSDAAFFFAQDKKTLYTDWIEQTKSVIFQIRLGSLFDKAERIASLSAFLAKQLNQSIDSAKRAAFLSKADLMSGMVGEFPELQGLMGYHYALDRGEPKEIALALYEQYFPRFSADQLPREALGSILSLADRIDTLVGIFGIGLKPSGVKDPFKLRRQALAVGRLLISFSEPLSFTALVEQAYDFYSIKLDLSIQEIITELRNFIFERLVAYYHALGISADKMQAVRACQADWFYDFDKRLHALHQFVGRPEAQALAAACKRVGNILQGQKEISATVLSELLIEPAEEHLYTQLCLLELSMTAQYEKADYQSILESLALLRDPIDTFFNTVMVMVEDSGLKKNRLALLSKLQQRLQSVADISLLQS